MGIQGRLTQEKMASNVPVNEPGYNSHPIYYEDVNAYVFEYETDEHAIAELLPEKLSVADPATATLAFIDYPKSSLGPYLEVFLAVNAVYKGEQFPYSTNLFLDQNAAIMAGREIWGFPKKSAFIEFTQQEDILGMYAERPKGIRICSAVFRDPMNAVLPLPENTVASSICLRAIPSPEENKKHSILELVKVDVIIKSGSMSVGEGSCHFSGISAFDPWHMLPVKTMKSCYYAHYDASTLTYGKVIENLL